MRLSGDGGFLDIKVFRSSPSHYIYSIKYLFLVPFIALFIFPSLAGAAEQSYIVVFKESASLKSEVAEIKEESSVPRVFSHALKGAQVTLTPKEKAELALDSSVRYIEKDAPVQALRETSLWGLDRIDQRSLPLNNQFSASATGAGVNAYIVDTGIRSDHTQFAGRVLPGHSTISDGRGTADCDGHGTHVAGTVAGATYGVAPGARIIPVRVLDCFGSGTWSGVIAGIDWIVSNHQAGEKATANLSIGGGKSLAVNEAVARLVSDGVSVAVAAGNESSNACSYSPASAPEAITVGATTSADTKSSFSNNGPCVDIFAPGSGVLSADKDSSTDSATLSGTSMASPHVAGALALVLEEGRAESDLLAQATEGKIITSSLSTANRLLYLGDAPQPPAPASPENDNFASALSLNIGANTGSNLLATKEPGEPDHVFSYSKGRTSIWYSWTAPASGEITLSTAGSNFDTLLAVYRGSSLSALTKVIANDDAIGTNTSQVFFKAQAGETYKIAVDGYNGASGQVSLAATFAYISKPLYIPSGPSFLTNSSAATFTFAGGAGAFECSLDGGPWQSCSSPKSYTDLADGRHAFRVRSFETEPVFYEWEIDTSAPSAPSITSSPPAETEERRASFSFKGETGASFQCSLDGSAPTTCFSPTSYSVGAGNHTFTVWQKDSAGNSSKTTSYSWRVKEIAPPPSPPPAPSFISAPPASTFIDAANISFSGQPGASFQCNIDNLGWEGCASPVSYSSLFKGTHIFSVRQIVAGQVSSSATYSWQVASLEAPLITRAPASSPSRQARFFFKGQGSFLCKLDDKNWGGCSSPRTYNNLSVGRHTFRVRSVAEGVFSPISSYSWRVQKSND